MLLGYASFTTETMYTRSEPRLDSKWRETCREQSSRLQRWYVGVYVQNIQAMTHDDVPERLVRMMMMMQG